MQGQRGALHRHPAPVLHHRPRGVDAQRHRGAAALLGLDDLHVGDVEPPRCRRPARRSAALVRVRGTCHGFGVAERPRPGRAGRLARGAGAAGLPLAAAAARAGPTTSRSADSPSRRSAFGRQPQRAVGHPLEEALAAQLALQLGQRAGVDPGLLAQRGRQRVEVDVLQRRARVGLRRAARPARPAGPAPPSPGWPRPCPAGCRRGTGPEPSSPPPAAVPCSCASSWASACASRGSPNACWDSSASSARCSARHRVEHPLRGGGPLRPAGRPARRCSAGSPGRTRRARP